MADFISVHRSPGGDEVVLNRDHIVYAEPMKRGSKATRVILTGGKLLSVEEDLPKLLHPPEHAHAKA